MTREELRQQILTGIDKALGYGWLLTQAAKDLLKAQKTYWTQDDGTELDKLLVILQGHNGPPSPPDSIPWILSEKESDDMAQTTVKFVHQDDLKTRLEAKGIDWNAFIALAQKYGAQVFLMAQDLLPYLEGTQPLTWAAVVAFFQKYGPLVVQILPELLALFGLHL